MPGRRWRLALVIALIAGVVAMHHVAMGHGHGAGHGGAHAVAKASSETVGVAEASFEAFAHRPTHAVATPAEPGDAHAAAAMLHLCLAVLAGLLAAVVLVLVARTRSGAAHPPARTRAMWGAPRAPPVPLRLARLQVLRI